MQIESMNLKVALVGSTQWQEAVRMLYTFLYTAMSESLDCIKVCSFVLLLTVTVESPEVEIGVVSHIYPFFRQFRSLADLFVSGNSAELTYRIGEASKIVQRVSARISKGRFVPHEILLDNGNFSIKPNSNSTITIPRISTSDVLIALSALIDGRVLPIEWNGPPEYRDRLFLEYLDRAQMGEPISFDDFGCRDDNPESWFLRQKDVPG